MNIKQKYRFSHASNINSALNLYVGFKMSLIACVLKRRINKKKNLILPANVGAPTPIKTQSVLRTAKTAKQQTQQQHLPSSVRSFSSRPC